MREPVQQPAQNDGLLTVRANVQQRRQRVQQQLTADLVEVDVAAQVDHLAAGADLHHRRPVRREQLGRVDRLELEVAGQDESTGAVEDHQLTRRQPDRRVLVEDQPALPSTIAMSFSRFGFGNRSDHWPPAKNPPETTQRASTSSRTSESGSAAISVLSRKKSGLTNILRPDPRS